MARRSKTGFWLNDTGAAAAIYALALPALVAIAGIGFDYARMASLDTELQNAADQATLAAATQLDKTVGAQTRAIDAASNLASNDTLFANDGGGLPVTVASVTFFANAADAEAGTNGFNNPGSANDDGRAAFVRVTVATRTANYALTPIVGAISGEIADAQAVAGVGRALCRTPPLMMCNPTEPDGNDLAGLDFDAGAYVGVGFVAKKGGGNKWAPGNYGWLDTGLGTGADAVREGIGWDFNPGGCLAQDGVATVDMQPGNIANAPQAMNTRFDIQGWCETGGSCSAALNTRKDLVRAANASSGQGCELHNNGWKEVASSGQYLPASNAPYDQAGFTDANWPIASMGHPRDICHSTATVSCAGSGVLGDGIWDRDAYFRTHYLRTTVGVGGAAGTRWKANQWRGNLGLSGGANPSRFEVYQWEIDHRSQTIDGVVILGPNPPGPTYSPADTLVNHGRAICGAETSGASVGDRRRISVAVVNCNAHSVKGNMSDVPVRRWIDVFLVQPSLNRNRTGQDEIYVEIIGDTTAGSAGETAGTVIRRDLPYLLR